MKSSKKLRRFESDVQPTFKRLEQLQNLIHKKLTEHTNGKTLKGNDFVGCLGEICGKLLLGGRLVDESHEHDLETNDGRRVSVKARKGYKLGWQRSSAIPKIEGAECPTHLLFVHLNDDYSVEKAWLFPWADLVANNRFKRHMVRGSQRSFIFRIELKDDKDYLIYSK